MPGYELTLIMRKMARPQLVDSLKRVSQHIYDNGGYIRKIESLGERRLPNIKKIKGETHSEGTYVQLNLDLTTASIPIIRDEYSRDKDIVQKFLLARDSDTPTCPAEFDEELLPPGERPSVQELIRVGRRPPRFRKIFKDKTGLDYYPFHR